MPAHKQVLAARVATLAVGGIAIAIGIAAKGQNVAALVGLAFAVAASANFPCLILTLYWRRCNTTGIIAGMVVGTTVAVGLTLVSPNLTYPLAVRSAASKVLAAGPAKRALIDAALASEDVSVRDKAVRDAGSLDKDLLKARADLIKVQGQQTSFMGLEKPLIALKNPGIFSIPLGFLAVLLGSLLSRDKRAEALWDEVQARRLTGLFTSQSSGH